jgi:hypothetical protein
VWSASTFRDAAGVHRAVLLIEEEVVGAGDLAGHRHAQPRLFPALAHSGDLGVLPSVDPAARQVDADLAVGIVDADGGDFSARPRHDRESGRPVGIFKPRLGLAELGNDAHQSLP